MYAFAYLIPRALLAGMVVCALIAGGDPLAKYVLTQHLQRSTGVIVEVGRVKTKVSQGKVFVNDLALVMPTEPLTNLFQSDMAYLEVDSSALLNRQCVIENARASQVRINVPRTVIAQQGVEVPATSAPENEFQSNFRSREEDTRMAWMDQFRSPAVTEAEPVSDVKIFEVAAQTNQRWNLDFQRHTQQVTAVQASFVKLADAAITPDEVLRNGLTGPPNPLRGADLSSDSNESNLESLLKRLESLQFRQHQLESQADIDLKELEAAYRADLSRLNLIQSPGATRVDPETLTRLLLTKLHEEIAGDAMEWFQGVRGNLPLGADGDVSNISNRPSGYRGDFVSLAGVKPKPTVIIENLLFDGAGHFQKQHINFAGEAQQISDVPPIHSQPITFSIRAQGQQHFVVEGSFDRRGQNELDSIAIQIPDFPIGARQLGTPAEMLVTLGPKTTIHGVIDLQVEHGNIIGNLSLEFTDIALLVEHLHEVAGGKESQVRLNHSLATLARFESVTQLSGSLANPVLQVESSLGRVLADAIAEISVTKSDKNKLAQQEQVGDFYRKQVVPLKNNITAELEKMRYAINGNNDIAQKLRSSMRAANARWPKIR